MHDGIIVVRSYVVSIVDVLVEVVLSSGLDFIPVNGNECIPVSAAVFVPQTNRMANFMDRAA